MLQEILSGLQTGARTSILYLIFIAILCFVITTFLEALCIHSKRPRNIKIFGASLAWGKWLSSIQYVFQAPDLIQRAYDQSKGEPFSVPALSEYQIFVSSEKHIQEVNESSQDQLSLHEAMEDRVKQRYTFYGFEHGSIDPHDSVPGRVLKFLLRTNIPELRPKIQQRIEQAFDISLSRGKLKDDWTEVSLLSLSETIGMRINCQVITGDTLADNPRYVDACLRYQNDVILSMEFCRYMPSFLVPYACPAIMSWSGAMEKVANHIRPLVIQRLEAQKDGKALPLDCITWVIAKESSSTPQQRTVMRIVQQIIALIFASAHQLPLVLVFVIYNLCLHPEYIPPLTTELENMLLLPPSAHYKNTPLLESFLRESARMNPLDSVSIQRKVMQPFTLSNGTYIPSGNTICVPQAALMHSPHNYASPSTFNGYRFVLPEDRDANEPKIKYTDVSAAFPFWGASRKACPGRWYVSSALKQIIAHLLLKYEISLAPNNPPLTMRYTTMVIPRHGTKVLLRKKQ